MTDDPSPPAAPAAADDPNRAFAAHVAAELTRAGHVALFAGGCVRDRLMGRTPKDFDVATDAVPAKVRAVFGKRRTLAVGESFGVIVVLPDRRRFPGAQQVEVATFREDAGYADGRRPDSVRFSTPEKDAARRDFTVNGLFEDPATGAVIDHVGGVADLAAGVLRAIGDPAERMAEDSLRMLRFARFATTLNLRPDEATAAAVVAAADRLPAVSGERVGQEMRKLLASPRRHVGVALLEKTGLLPHIAPAVAALPGPKIGRTRRLLEHLAGGGVPVPFSASLAGLFLEVGAVEEPVRRWKLSNEKAKRAADLVAHRRALDGFADFPPHRKKRLAAEPFFADLLILAEADRLLAEQDGEEVRGDPAAARRFLDATPEAEIAPPPLLTGGDLIAAGMQPGPEFKRLLDRAYDAQLDGAVGTTAEALALVRDAG